MHRLAGTQQRLRRDAGPVRALAADELALDERDAQAALGERAGAVLARRAAADDDHVVVGSCRQLLAGLLRDHVLGVPVGPVLVGLARARLVLAVRGGRAPQRARQVARPRRTPSSRVDPAGQPRRDLLQQPAVAVRVAERGEGAVAAVVGRRARSTRPRAVGLELGARLLGVEHLADLDAAGGELVARGLDVGDDQVEALGRARRGRGDLRAELDRAPRAGRRELDDPEAVVEGEVGVEPPAEARVERLGAIDVGDRDDDGLELHVRRASRGGSGGTCAAGLNAAHLEPPVLA